MIKKSIKLLLVLTMLLSAFSVTALAQEDYTVSQQAQVLKSLGALSGDPDGNLRLGDTVTRAEFTKMAVAMSSVRNSVSEGLGVSPFKDVQYGHWAAPYVRLAVTSGYVAGYSDSSFRPDNEVTYAEAVTITLKLLGYTDDDFGASWPYGQMGAAKNLGLTDGIEGDYNAPISRGGCVILLNNLLDTKMKNSAAKYASVIDCEIKENIVLIATNDEDSSVPYGKISTTAGTYKLGESFDKTYVGSKGNAIVRNGDEIISFVSENGGKAEKIVVYSCLGNVVIGYKDGQLTQVTIPSGTTAYSGAAASTFGGVSSRISMGSILSLTKDSRGNIEYVSITEGVSLKGPAIVSGGAWYSSFTDSISGYSVIRNGGKASLSSLKTNDVAYLSDDLKIMFVYSNTKTGIYESAYPNKDTPVSVKVSGVTYEIEGAEAFKALCSGGSLKYGDSVTLLLGKDGKVAGAVSASGVSGSVYGYLTGSGKKNFTDENGDEYSSYYIEIVSASGEKTEYVTKSNYSKSVNKIVKVTFSSGYAIVSTMKSQTSVSGTVDAAAMTIGSHKVAQNVAILDISTLQTSEKAYYKSVYLPRLDGVDLSTRDIVYYTKNSDGEIDQLVLDDVTGDVYTYGVVTKVDKETGKFTIDINGTQSVVSGSFTSVSSSSPVKIVYSGNLVQALNPLSKVTVDDLTAGYITSGTGVIYSVSDSVLVYKISSGSAAYTLMPINELAENKDDYRITAYYDKKDKDGGRVRVIIATEK